MERQHFQCSLFRQICQIWPEAASASLRLCSHAAGGFIQRCVRCCWQWQRGEGEEKLPKWKRWLKEMCIHRLTVHCLPAGPSGSRSVITFLHKLLSSSANQFHRLFIVRVRAWAREQRQNVFVCDVNNLYSTNLHYCRYKTSVIEVHRKTLQFHDWKPWWTIPWMNSAATMQPLLSERSVTLLFIICCVVSICV